MTLNTRATAGEHAITLTPPPTRRRGPSSGSGRLNAQCPAGRPHDNRSHPASEEWYRGSDLAVTAGELNAGAGVGRLEQFQKTDDD